MAGSLIELGIDFVPVPGVKPALDTLVFIWQNVQRASNNKEVLRNLAISAADILTAVNHVLEEHDPTKHMRAMLHKLELILNDICVFAAEHATMNMFKRLVKNVDVEGQIEFFQNRLQNLWVAFNIVALGTIGSEVHLIHQGQQPGVKLNPPSEASPAHPQEANVQAAPRNPQTIKIHHPPMPHGTTAEISHSQNYQEISDDPVLVLAAASSTIPYKIEIRKNEPFLSSRYNSKERFFHWGLRPETDVTKKSNGFEISLAQDSKSWTWTLAGKVISILRHDTKHPTWQDSMDLIFSNGDSAVSWFSWFEAYASSPPSVRSLLPDPPTFDLTLRKKTSHSMIRKSATTIDYKRPTAESWAVILRVHGKTAREHASQLTYISTASYGRLPFCKLYRCGDTLVYERFIRADSSEPVISRRYCFETVDQARTWYTFWKDCAMNPNEDEDLSQIELMTTYGCVIKSKGDNILLSSKVWPNVDLRDWGAPNLERPAASKAVTFNWMNRKVDTITVNAAIDVRPDWCGTLDIKFHKTKSASIWFSFLTGRTEGTLQSNAPRKANVTVTSSRVSWMRQDSKDSIQTRAATSDNWTSVFGTSCSNFKSHGSHMSIVSVGSLVPPIIRIWTNGSILHLDRRRTAEEKDAVVSRRYVFDSSAEAEAWYEIWKKRLTQLQLTAGTVTLNVEQ